MLVVLFFILFLFLWQVMNDKLKGMMNEDVKKQMNGLIRPP